MTYQAQEEIDQWFLARWGKFTASENYKLLIANGTNMFGAGAMTYIKTKALEMATQMWERPELEEVKALLHGKMYEYPAYKAFVQATGYQSMKYLGTETPLFLEYEPLANESGGSPDIISLTSDAKVDALAEIKCPKNPMYHFERLKWKTQWDLKEAYMSCYCQIQNLMLITGAGIAFFVSYDERQVNQAKKCKIIEVKPDKKFQDNLDLRLRMAVKEKYKVFDEYMNC
jgi:hypothetical protein